MKIFMTTLLATVSATIALAQAVLPMTEAEVRKVDIDAKKITLKHGEIKNLGMPPMSMVFQMKDPSQLGKFKVGDKVQFSAENVNGAYTVVTIEPILAQAALPSQTVKPAMPSASMPQMQMQKGMAGSGDMKQSMMMGMDSMQTMQMSGNIDKDFAMMMKIHHQGALDMAEMELAQGKSPEMKAMAKKIIAAQKKEIAEFDKWLAKQK